MAGSELRKLTTPSPQRRSGMVSRSNSRSKGINFNTVTPSPLKTVNTISHNKLPETVTSKHQQRINSHGQIDRQSQGSAQKQHLHYDFVLPLADQLNALDIDEQLRLLALKEMNVVEIKDGISDLKNKLNQTERDLRQLRELIQRSLYKEMVVHSPKSPKQRNGQVRTRQRNVSGADGRSIELKENQPPDRLSKIWSNFSKPITFIHQIDSMIQNEFEKSLGGDYPSLPTNPPKESINDPSKEINHRQREYNSDPSPLKDRTNYNNPSSYYHNLLQYSESPEDMLEAVSSSLWSFVNNMKANMLATLNDQTEITGKPPPPESETAGIDDLTNQDDISMDALALSDEESFSEEIDEVDLTIYSSMRRNNDKKS